MRNHKLTWAQWLAVPRDFLHGLLGGLFGPLLALLGVVGMFYLVTRQLPAFKEVTKGDGTRRRAIVLASPLEARATWARYGGELRGVLLEIRACAQAKLRQSLRN